MDRKKPDRMKVDRTPPQAIQPCGCRFRVTLHPAHLLIDARASDNRLPRYPLYASKDDTHRQYSAPPAPPAAPYQWYSSPRPPRASWRPHTPPASKYIPDPTRAGYTPDQKSPLARW